MSSSRTWSSPNCVAVVRKDSLASAIEPKCGHSHRCRGSRRSFHHLAALPDNQGEAKGTVLTSDIACGTPSRALVATCEWQGFVRPASRMSVLLHTPVIFAQVQCHSRRESPAAFHLRQQKPRRARHPGTRGDDGSANSRSQLRGLPCSRQGELAAVPSRSHGAGKEPIRACAFPAKRKAFAASCMRTTTRNAAPLRKRAVHVRQQPSHDGTHCETPRRL